MTRLQHPVHKNCYIENPNLGFGNGKRRQEAKKRTSCAEGKNTKPLRFVFSLSRVGAMADLHNERRVENEVTEAD